ncbi:MAG: hypothetical protein RL427_253 [Bacteroidota bacterium]
MANKSQSKNERPHLQLAVSQSDKVTEVLVVLVLVVFWIYTLLSYKTLPDVIPTHFVADGKADGYGLKWTILTLPLVGLLFYIGLSVLGRYPHKFNYPVDVTKANAEQLYRSAVQMLRVMKLVLIIVFFVMTYQTVESALGITSFVTKNGLFIDFALMFIPLFYFLIKMSKNA